MEARWAGIDRVKQGRNCDPCTLLYNSEAHRERGSAPTREESSWRSHRSGCAGGHASSRDWSGVSKNSPGFTLRGAEPSRLSILLEELLTNVVNHGSRAARSAHWRSLRLLDPHHVLVVETEMG